MTTKLSSLRVTAEMDVSQYVRAAAQKVSADGDMAGSAKAVGQALAATDAAASKAVPGVASISRVWITGYGDAAKFESAVRSVGKALDRGMDPARAAAALDGVYRKFGQTADAASLARQGFVALAPVVTALNDRYDVNAAVADRAAAATKRLADAQSAQQRINASFGIGASAGSAQDSADAFLGSVGGLEGIAKARGRAVAESFTQSLNDNLIAGASRSARQSASAFTEYFDGIAAEIKRRETEIAATTARIQTIQERLQQAHRIGYQFDSTQGARASMSAFIEEDERAVRSLTQAYDPLLTNEQRRNEAMKTAQGLLARRSIDEKQYATVVTNINKVHDDTRKALEGAFTATGKYTSGVGLARHELINLSRQVQDVFVSLASGQPIMTVAIQQFTQIGDIFASSRGSVMGFLGQMGPALLRLAGPIAAVTTALVAMYAAFKVTSEQQTLSNSLLGAGRPSGLTGGELEALAKQSADTAQITVSNARLIGAEFVKLGRVANDNLPRLTRITKDYAAATGQDLKNSAQEIAQALADPSRGAQGLSDKIGGLDSTTLRMIRTATDFNDKLRAQKLLMEELGRATDNAADQSLSKWDRLAKEMGLVFGRLKEGAAGAVLGPDRSEEISTARARVREIEQQLASGRTSPGQDFGLRAEVGTLREKLSALEALQQKEQEGARNRAQASEANKRIADGEVAAVASSNQGLAQRLKLYNETIGQVRTLESSVEELKARRNAIGIPDATNRGEFATLTQQIKEQSEALEGQQKRLRDLTGVRAGLSVEQERAARAVEIDLKASKDRTLEDAKATAALRAMNDAFGESTSKRSEAVRVETAQREATVRGTVALNEQSKTIQDGIAVTNAQAEAYRRGGVAAAEVARIRKEAEQQARTSGGDVEVIFRERLNKEIAETKRGLAEKIALQRQEVSVTTAVNAAAISGNLSTKQRADLEERLQAEREAYNKLIATGLVTDKEAARLAKEQADSVARGQNARADAAALGMLADQRESTELLRLEVSLLGKSVDERTRALAVLKAEQALRRQGVDPQSELGKQYVDGAKLEASLTATRDRFVDLSKDLGQIIGGVFDDLFTKTDKGFAGIADNALKSFAKLGSRLIEQQIITPLVQGRGLGHLFASNDNSDPKLVKEGAEAGVFSGVRKAFEGIGSFLFGGGGGGKPLDISNGGAGAGSGLISMKGLGSLGMAGLAGFGMGQQSQNPIIGGIGGALSGFAAGAASGFSFGGPLGALIGAGAGILGGIMGQQQAKKQRRQQMMQLIQQYQDEWAELKPQADVFTRQLAGETVGTLETSIRDANSEASRTANAASKAGDTAAVERINKALDAFNSRTVREFATGIDGMMASFANGTGPNSPFNQARAAMLSLGENVTGFVADVAYAAGEFGASALAAQKAAAEFAIGSLKVTEPLSTVEQRLQEIRGAASGLQQVLVDLGYSAEAAALAVRDGTTAAIDQLRGRFDSDLRAKTNSARGLDYLNQARQLIDEVAQLRQDAALLGAGGERVDDYFRAAAQEIVNSAQLTGAAFDAFIADFPAFAGSVRAYGRELNEVAQAAANATRRLQYQDRLFAALNDTTTLEGQLAAFDRQAQRDRESELKAGGDELLALEEAIAAERLKLVSNYYDEMVQREQQALQEARNFFDTFSRNLREFVDGLRAGAQSPLSPEARLAAAQSQYNAQLALAQGGNRDAANSLTKYASDLIDAARGFHASSAGFQAIFNQVTAQLTALPTQVSAEQYIVDAIKDSKVSVLASLSVLDTNGDGMISRLEAANSKLAGIFTEIDINGDGQISKLEAILADAGATRTALQAAINLGPQSTATALAGYFQQLDTSVNGLLDYGEFRSGLNGLASDAKLAQIFAELDTNGDGQLSRLELIKAATQDTSARTAEVVSLQGTANSLASTANALQNSAISIATSMNSLLSAISSLNSTQVSTLAALNAQFSLTSSLTIRGSSVNNNMVTALNKIAYNTAWIMLYTGSSGGFGDSNLGAYASGGWIRGPGTPTSDSVPIWASDGEFMVNASAARRHFDLLEAINGGASVADIAAIGRQQLTPMRTYSPAAANQNDGASAAEIRALREEVRALRAELERNTRAVVAGAEHVRDGIDEGTGVQRAVVRETKFKRSA